MSAFGIAGVPRVKILALHCEAASGLLIHPRSISVHHFYGSLYRKIRDALAQLYYIQYTWAYQDLSDPQKAMSTQVRETAGHLNDEHLFVQISFY